MSLASLHRTSLRGGAGYRLTELREVSASSASRGGPESSDINSRVPTGMLLVLGDGAQVLSLRPASCRFRGGAGDPCRSQGKLAAPEGTTQALAANRAAPWRGAASRPPNELHDQESQDAAPRICESAKHHA